MGRLPLVLVGQNSMFSSWLRAIDELRVERYSHVTKKNWSNKTEVSTEYIKAQHSTGGT